MSTLLTTTSSTRPSSPSAGDTYFETDTNNIIVYDGTNWRGYQNDGIALSPITNTTSVALDGTDDHVLIPSNSAYGFGTGDFTIICWFYVNSTVTNYIGIYDFRPGGTGSRYPSLFISPNNGARYYYYNGGSGGTINYDDTPNAGQWYCSAVTRSSSAVTLYRDGVSVATGTDSNTLSTPTSGIYVGMRGNSSLELNGYVDEFAIFDKALTSTQISDVYNGGNPVNLSPLEPLSWFRMGDGDTGSTVIDHGSLGNDATLQNDASFSTTTAP